MTTYDIIRNHIVNLCGDLKQAIVARFHIKFGTSFYSDK